MIGKFLLSCLQHFGTSVPCCLRKAIMSQTSLRLQWQFWASWEWQLWPLTQGWRRGQRNLRSPLWLQPSVAALCPQVSWRIWFEAQLFPQTASAPSQRPPWRDTLPVHASLLAALFRVLHVANFIFKFNFHVEFVRFPWCCTTVQFFLFPSYVLRFQCLHTWLLLNKWKSSVEWDPRLSAVMLTASTALWRWNDLPRTNGPPSHQSCSWPLIIHPNGHKTDASRSKFKIKPNPTLLSRQLPSSLYFQPMGP